MRLAFDPPLKHEALSCSEMTLREPTGAEVLEAEKAKEAEVGAQARRVRDQTLVAAVAKVDIALVRRMPASRFKAAAAFVNAFDAAAGQEEKPCTDAQLVIPLDARIEKMGRIVDQLELCEPTTGEVAEAQRKVTTASDHALRAMQIHLVALVADLPRPVIEAVPISKLNQASRYLLGFT